MARRGRGNGRRLPPSRKSSGKSRSRVPYNRCPNEECGSELALMGAPLYGTRPGLPPEVIGEACVCAVCNQVYLNTEHGVVIPTGKYKANGQVLPNPAQEQAQEQAPPRPQAEPREHAPRAPSSEVAGDPLKWTRNAR